MVSKFALSGSQKLKISCLAGAAPQVGAAMRLKAGAARKSLSAGSPDTLTPRTAPLCAAADRVDTEHRVACTNETPARDAYAPYTPRHQST